MLDKRNFVFSRGIVIQALILGLLWYLLAGHMSWSWWIGAPAIVCSLVVSHYLPVIPDFRIKFRHLLLFIVFFLCQSVVGGVDVAFRALNPRCPIDPGFMRYKLNINNELARVFFINSISLLPGTLSACLEDEDVLVHVLDQTSSNQKNIYMLEKKVAAMFGEDV